MVNVVLISVYLRTSDYPQKYSLSSMRLAAYIMDKPNVNVTILPVAYDMTEEELDKIAQKLDNMNIGILGLSAYVWTWSLIKKLSCKIKSRDKMCIMVGGPETNNHTNISWKGDELFVLGEGERFLDELCNLMINNVSPKEIAQKKRIADGEKRGEIYVIPSSEQLAWKNGLYSDKFFDKLCIKDFSNEFMWLDTSRGCMYHCGYCGFRGRTRIAVFSNEIIHEEIVNIGNINPKRLFIVDANMGGIPEKGKFILRELIKYAPNTKLTAYLRPEFLDDEYLDLIKKSNIEELRLGIQTINENVPKWLRSNDVNAIKNMLPRLTETGVIWRAELIVGLPGDDFESLKESIRFVINEIKPPYLYAYHLSILAGTEMSQIQDEKQTVWIKGEGENNRAYSSYSYTHEELEKMLEFSNAITEKYNKLLVKKSYEELLVEI